MERGAESIVTEDGTSSTTDGPTRDTLPIVVWGNGACMADGHDFAGYLSTIASYGFLVVTTAAVPKEPQARITSAHLIKALDWAQAESTRAGSALAGKIKSDSVAVMGMSCGGNLALEAARDPRVKTLGMWNSGVWISGEMRAADGTLLVATTKADLERVHSPTLYINGDKIDPTVWGQWTSSVQNRKATAEEVLSGMKSSQQNMLRDQAAD